MEAGDRLANLLGHLIPALTPEVCPELLLEQRSHQATGSLC